MRKSTAYLLGASTIEQSNRELGNDIIRSNRELGETLKSISDAEIKSKDRVDISLEEYENTKNKIESLSSEVNRLNRILQRLELPLDKPIVPDSIRTFWREDPMNRRLVFRVELAIDEGDLRDY